MGYCNLFSRVLLCPFGQIPAYYIDLATTTSFQILLPSILPPGARKSVCVWIYIYIYIYIFTHTQTLYIYIYTRVFSHTWKRCSYTCAQVETCQWPSNNVQLTSTCKAGVWYTWLLYARNFQLFTSHSSYHVLLEMAALHWRRWHLYRKDVTWLVGELWKGKREGSVGWIIKAMIRAHFQDYFPLNILRFRTVDRKIKDVTYVVIHFFLNYSSLQKTFFQFFVQVIFMLKYFETTYCQFLTTSF